MRAALVTLTICLLALPANAKYSGGTGEPNDPYQIATAADLIALGETPEDYDKHFILTADIDLDPNLPGRRVFDRAVIAPDTNEAQSGFQGTSFTGFFDAGSHTISHLTIKGGSYLGLFGQLGSWDAPACKVTGLGLVDVNIAGSGSSVGGLVGYNSGSVKRCYSAGSVSGSKYVGGLVGENYYGSVTQCYSAAAVSGRHDVGGLVGVNWEWRGFVTQCYSTGVVSVTDQWSNFVGGLVGGNSGTVLDCYSTSAVSGYSSVGGLVGWDDGNVTHCYSTGPISASTSSIGGLVGEKRMGHVTGGGCFWDTQTSGQATSAAGTGLTTAQMQEVQAYLDAGWDFVGQPDGPHDIWAQPDGGGYPILWWQLSPWPELPRFSGGSGEPNNPYLISTPEQLNSIGHNPRLLTCHFRLVDNLDLTGVHFFPIGDDSAYPYTGVFDGDDHVISHLTIQGGSYLGLFGALEGEVKNLGIVDANIVGAGWSVGSLVGWNEGNVTHCYSSGTVSGREENVGGLVGENQGNVTECFSRGVVSGVEYVGGLIGYDGGAVSRCYSTCTVRGGSCVGGLVGETCGTVTQCFGTGTVEGNDHVGGLIGVVSGATIRDCYSTASVAGCDGVGGLVGAGAWDEEDWPPDISRCYSAGPVAGDNGVGGLVPYDDGSLNACFWDLQISGQTTNVGGYGLTTAQMQTAKTFLDAGWDFVGETVNGTEDIWWILEGKDYPRLWWETAAE